MQIDDPIERGLFRLSVPTHKGVSYQYKDCALTMRKRSFLLKNELRIELFRALTTGEVKRCRQLS